MTIASVAVVSSFVAHPLSGHQSLNKFSLQIPRGGWRRKQLGFALVAVTASEFPSEGGVRSSVFSDPELRLVFELATDSELYELENILFGPSDVLMKSIPNKGGGDMLMLGQNIEVRDGFIESLESRFLFLAADARSLNSEGLEAFIQKRFYLREASGIFPGLWESFQVSEVNGSLELGLSKWKVELLAALQVGATEVQAIILKGGSMITFAKVYHLLAKKLSGKVFLEAANYQMRREMLKKFALVFISSYCIRILTSSLRDLRVNMSVHQPLCTGWTVISHELGISSSFACSKAWLCRSCVQIRWLKNSDAITRPHDVGDITG